jgi:hypothetical protein
MDVKYMHSEASNVKMLTLPQIGRIVVPGIIRIIAKDKRSQAKYGALRMISAEYAGK